MIQHLEATVQAFYRIMFVDDIDNENLPKDRKMGMLRKVAFISNGKTFRCFLHYKHTKATSILFVYNKIHSIELTLSNYSESNCNKKITRFF